MDLGGWKNCDVVYKIHFNLFEHFDALEASLKEVSSALDFIIYNFNNTDLCCLVMCLLAVLSNTDDMMQPANTGSGEICALPNQQSCKLMMS